MLRRRRAIEQTPGLPDVISVPDPQIVRVSLLKTFTASNRWPDFIRTVDRLNITSLRCNCPSTYWKVGLSPQNHHDRVTWWGASIIRVSKRPERLHRRDGDFKISCSTTVLQLQAFRKKLLLCPLWTQKASKELIKEDSCLKTDSCPME
jgi:hypothetical protein